MPGENAERTRIMDAAYNCLATSNGEGVSVTSILRVAGLGTRAFYRHFDSKDSLLLALFHRDSDALYARLEAAASEAGTPAEALRGWILAYLRVTMRPHLRQRVVVLSSAELRRASGYGDEHDRWTARLDSGIADILRRGLRDGSFPQARPEFDARAIRATVIDTFHAQMASEAEADSDEVAEHVIDFALRAVGAVGAGQGDPTEQGRREEPLE